MKKRVFLLGLVFVAMGSMAQTNLSSGIDPKNLDTSVKPGNDFITMPLAVGLRLIRLMPSTRKMVRLPTSTSKTRSAFRKLSCNMPLSHSSKVHWDRR